MKVLMRVKGGLHAGQNPMSWTLLRRDDARELICERDRRSVTRSAKTTMKPWIILLVAAALEVGWAIGLKYTAGFTRLWPSVATIAAMGLSMYLLAVAARTLPMGTAYAVWTGIGAVGTAALGMLLFSEPANAGRLICIGLIICSVAGLKVFSP